MNFNFSKDKIIIGIAIIALAGFGYYKSSSDSLNSNQIQSIVDTKQTDNINNQSEVENKENEDNSSKMCQVVLISQEFTLLKMMIELKILLI